MSVDPSPSDPTTDPPVDPVTDPTPDPVTDPAQGGTDGQVIVVSGTAAAGWTFRASERAGINGEKGDPGPPGPQGPPGADGLTITAASFDSGSGSLLLTLSDGSVLDAGPLPAPPPPGP